MVNNNTKEPITKDEAKAYLMDAGRYVITPEYAKELTEAFGLAFNESLVRSGKHGYREWDNENVVRVNVSSLAEDICKRLGREPDKQMVKDANSMFGEGSHRDKISKAYANNL